MILKLEIWYGAGTASVNGAFLGCCCCFSSFEFLLRPFLFIFSIPHFVLLHPLPPFFVFRALKRLFPIPSLWFSLLCLYNSMERDSSLGMGSGVDGRMVDDGVWDGEDTMSGWDLGWEGLE